MKSGLIVVSRCHKGRWKPVYVNCVVFRQMNESPSELSLVSPNFSNTSSPTTEAMSNVKGKMIAGQMSDISSEETQEDGGLASPVRSHTIDEIEEVIRAQLLRSFCSACRKLQDDGLDIKDERVAAMEDGQCHMVHCVYKCTFHVQWNAREFWIDQCRSEESTSLESIIILTGHAVDAQATTVGEYMRSHWPDTGAMLLDVLQGFLEDSYSAFRGMLTGLRTKHSKRRVVIVR
jgi:hypothetical protein